MTEAKKTGRVKHHQGLADYLALGPDRSLQKLWELYKTTMVQAPALVTIELWSRKHEWVRQASEYDAKVAAEVLDRTEEAAVEEGFDRTKALLEVAELALTKATAALNTDTLTADTPAEVKALIDSSVNAIRQIELLEGRATSRVDHLKSVPDDAPDWLRDRLSQAGPATDPDTALAEHDEGSTVH